MSVAHEYGVSISSSKKNLIGSFIDTDLKVCPYGSAGTLLIPFIVTHKATHTTHIKMSTHFFSQTDLRVILWRLACTYMPTGTKQCMENPWGIKCFMAHLSLLVVLSLSMNLPAKSTLCTSSYSHNECFYYYNFSV